MLKWTTGINDFKIHTLADSSFTTILTETDFEHNRKVNDIFYDHLSNRSGQKVEVLYSGGMDSELVLASCIHNKIPVEAMTMVIKVRGAILNVVDLYYSEKFCRENNIKQNFFYLDAVDFYESGKYIEYLEPYKITEPHVASHFWLLEQCNHYPIIGGDWPWVQAHKQNKVLSPFKLAFSGYELFMQSKGITGIGNMISHSFESCYHFMKEHIIQYEYGNDTFHTVPFMKYKMYGLAEPRIKSYGWEDCPKNIFNILVYKIELLKKFGSPKSKIVWGEQIKQLLNTDVIENSLFT